MTIAIVCTEPKLQSAIADYSLTLDDNQADHQIAMAALNDFIQNAEQAKLFFHRATNIYSFTLEYFLDQLEEWRDQEQARCPNQRERIFMATSAIKQLFRSRWLLDHSMVVRELLTGNEVYGSLS